MFVVAVVIMAALDWVMRRTMMGKAMRAVAHDGRREPDGNQRHRGHGRGVLPELGARGAQRLSPRADRLGLAVWACGRAQGLLGRDHRWIDQPARLRARRLRCSAFSSRSSTFGRRNGGRSSSSPGDPGPRVPAHGLFGTRWWRRCDAARAPDRRRAVAAGAALRRLANRQRLLPPHPLHDVGLLPLRGRHERAGRLRRAEVARAGRAVRRRRLRGRATHDKHRPQSVARACRCRRDAGALRRPDRLPSLRVRGPYLAMVTLAFGIVVEKLVSEWTEVFGGAQGIFGIKPLTSHGEPFTSLHWVWFGIALGAVTHLLLRNLLGGRFGRAFLSLQADEIAPSRSGSASIAPRSWPSSSPP